MKNTEKEIEAIMLSTLITKHGLMLNSQETAKAIRATKSDRGLSEDRKKGNINIPEYCDSTKSVLFPVQKVVEFHLNQSKQTVKKIS